MKFRMKNKNEKENLIVVCPRHFPSPIFMNELTFELNVFVLKKAWYTYVYIMYIFIYVYE